MIRSGLTLVAVATASLYASTFCPTASAADGPLPIRALAPDSTYVIVAADSWDKSLESWKQTGLHKLMQTEPMKKVFGADGATGSMDKRLKELGVPDGAASWPDAFGVALYTTHNTELDTDEAHMLFYGDWGARADGASQLIDAVLADAVKTDKWRLETGDEVLGRKVTTVHLPEDEAQKAIRERYGAQLGVEMSRTTEKLFYVRDGSRFFVSTERGGIEDALEAVDGKRKGKIPESKEYESAMDLLGAQDVSFVLLTGPMQKAMPGTGMGPLAMMEPVLQTLLGDVKAWCVGLDVQGPRGQLEVTGTALLSGPKSGVWTLLGPSAPIDAPPAMVAADAVSYGRMNVQFKEFMPLLNTLAANLPPDLTDFLDQWLLNFGPAVTKALDAIGPGMWFSSQVRQPLTPASLVSSTILSCSNPKAVVPVLAQFGPQMGLEPRDVDGNTIFGADGAPMAVGISNGYIALGDNKQVEQAMRTVGQKDLPSIADNPAYKKAAAAAGTEPLVGWGYTDMIARWSFDREMIKMAAEESASMGQMLEQADDSPWAKRLGFTMPANSLESLAAMEPATLAKYIGSTVWSVKLGEKGLVTRFWLMPGSGE